MNTKTNSQNVSNSYNGDTIGRNSPSALLVVLAEVASQTLHSETKHIDSLLAAQCKPRTASIKRKESCFTVSQLLSMPISQLVKQFTIFTSDELKRQYSYTCALVPGCQQKYTSFASEEKARASIKSHLEEHLEYLKADKETYDTFTAKSITHKNLKTNLQSKKSRIQQSKKPQETINKKNKDVILEKSTNYLRKILLNDINIKENEKQKCFQNSENKETHNFELKNSDQMDTKVLGDHSYFERLDDKMPNKKEMPSLNNVLDNTRKENIVLMVVGSDSVHMKEYSSVNQKLAENTNCQDSDILYSSDSWSEETLIKNTEISTVTKPKGKAKFIGTSKEEREMALAYIERIKKKGNPTGSNLQCRICDPPRSFTAPTTLVSHYRSHAGIKPYECRICRAVFTRRHSLKYHMLIHQNQTRFTCLDCGKKFRHPSHFREHQRRHTGEAPFGCDDCGQRFKTRNTYKRHLKTRHGKILTTIGEVLHLSEEDFEKVRTNRRKKDCVPESTMNVDNIESNVIVDFGNYHDKTQIVTNSIEEYVLKENIEDINRNLETKGTVQFVDKCLENFEICSESQLKTDGIETEIAIDCKYPDKNNKSVRVEHINGVEDGLLQLKNPFYENLKIINNEENHIIYQHNIENQNKVYDCSNKIQWLEYSEVKCNNETSKEEDEDIIEDTINIDLSEELHRNKLHVLQKSIHNYHKIICNSDMSDKTATYMHLETEQAETINFDKNNQTCGEKYDEHIIITQNNDINEKSNKYTYNAENKESAGSNITLCTQITNRDVNILQTVDTVREEIMPQNQDNNILRENEYVNKSIATDSIETINVSSKNSVKENQTLNQQQVNQCLYIHTDQLNRIIAQSTCINIPLHQTELYGNKQNQLQTKADNCRKVRILDSNLQAIDIKQPNKQNTILFVSNDHLKNGIFQIDRNSIRYCQSSKKIDNLQS
ncbi:hypothetical protein ACFW04_010603 [Cataglyphis niger]